MHPGSSLARFSITVYVIVLLALLFIRFAPFIANRDDFVRYYFGGYVGSVQIRGGEKSRALREELERASSNLPSTHDRLRFYAGKTPYVPFFIVTTPIGMAMFDLVSDISLATWILGFHTLLWAIGILGGALFIFRNPQMCSTLWFLAAGVVMAWLNVHTSPFLPVPRGVATLACGMALACYLRGGKTRPIILFLVAGSLFHSIQNLVNVGAMFLFLLLVWSDRPLEFLRSVRTWRIGFAAVAAALIGTALVWVANSMSFPQFSSMLDVRTQYDLWGNWDVNREAFETTVRSLGPLLLLLLFLEKGWRRTLACAALFLGGLLAVSFLGPSGTYYQGEYVQRLAAIWTLILFALLLRRDLFRALSDSIVRRKVWLASGIVLVCLLFLWRSFDAWNPTLTWQRYVAPSEKEWGPVETECLRILTDPV